MRSNIKVLILVLTMIISSVIFTKQASAQQANVSFQVFYDQLSPYGEWVNYPNYGYVWIPDAGSDFVPYSTEGHWILTDYGWTWMSDYSWGWAPFHYGRWDYDQYYGWLWIPGNEWGPAWVSWRRAEGYYGWAPMEPGITLSASFGRAYDSHDDHWIFVKDRDIDRSDINHYYISRTDQNRIIMRSSVINSTYTDTRRHTTYATGPARADFIKVTGRKVNPVAIQENNKPGQSMSNGHLMIYRPEVIKNNNKEKAPAPSRIVNLKDVKQPSERNLTNQQGNSNSKNSTKTDGQPKTANPQRSVNNVKTLPQKSPPSQNLKTANQSSNLRTKTTVPSQNVKRDQQPNNVKTLNTTASQNVKRDQQPDNVKTLNATPPQNVRKEEQSANRKTENANPSQNVKKGLQQNNGRAINTNPSQKTGRERQSNTAKSSANDKKDQQGKSNNADEIKKNE